MFQLKHTIWILKMCQSRSGILSNYFQEYRYAKQIRPFKASETLLTYRKLPNLDKNYKKSSKILYTQKFDSKNIGFKILGQQRYVLSTNKSVSVFILFLLLKRRICKLRPCTNRNEKNEIR